MKLKQGYFILMLELCCISGCFANFCSQDMVVIDCDGEVSKYCRFDRLPAANNSNIDHVWLEENLVETVGREGQKVEKHIGKSSPRNQKSWKKLAVVCFL